VWRAYTGVIHRVFGQILNLQNCFTTPNKNLGGDRGPQTDKHLPPSTFTDQSRHLGFGVFIDIWSMDRYNAKNISKDTVYIYLRSLDLF
jgi:hypothetical protein